MRLTSEKPNMQSKKDRREYKKLSGSCRLDRLDSGGEVRSPSPLGMDSQGSPPAHAPTWLARQYMAVVS